MVGLLRHETSTTTSTTNDDEVIIVVVVVMGAGNNPLDSNYRFIFHASGYDYEDSDDNATTVVSVSLLYSCL